VRDAIVSLLNQNLFSRRCAGTSPGPYAREFQARHRGDIDGLRAVAVIPVLLYHFHTDLFSGGFIGVDIFFVISGFVIAGSVMNDIRGGTFTIVNFYFKRVRRIFPALAVTIIVSSVAAALILLPSSLVDYSRSVISASMFLSNVYFWKSSGYFTSDSQTKPLLHTWSLSIEEQYYLLAPIAFLLIYRFGRKRWLLFFVPLILLSFATGVAAVFVGPTAGFFLLPARMWELLLGAVVALWNRPAPARYWIRETMSWLGIALILFGMQTLNTRDPYPGWNALFPCVGTILLIQAALGQNETAEMPTVNRILAKPPFIWIGLISYSLYLVHWPIAALVRYRALRDPTATEAAVMAFASIALAWLSWRFIELPFRHISLERRRFVLAGGAIVIAAGAAIGGLGILAKGLPARFPDLVERRIPGTEDWGGGQCFNLNTTNPTPWNPVACTRVHGTNGRILVWGDSFAAQYMPGVLRDAVRINADVLQYTFAGCPPILSYFSYARVGCRPFNRRALVIIREQHIDTVVLAGRWTDTPQRTLDQLADTVAELKKLGVRVFVFGQSPQFAGNVQDIDFISGSRLRPGKAYWPIAFDATLNDKIRQQAAAATYIDPLSHLCHDGLCAYRDGDVFYYADYGHFSTVGSLRAVQAYFPAGIAEQARASATDLPH
jgi:peptidoglycan/LPS O-acetylase OafA/YrhL